MPKRRIEKKQAEPASTETVGQVVANLEGNCDVLLQRLTSLFALGFGDPERKSLLETQIAQLQTLPPSIRPYRKAGIISGFFMKLQCC